MRDRTESKYDFVIVGAGLFGAVFAHKMTQAGKTCLVIDKRNHLGGNLFTKEVEGIQVHCYGAHIFHTNDKGIWDFVNTFAEFNRYTNSPIANYQGELFNLPFNMNTFYKMWGTKTPQEAQAVIAEQIADLGIEEPRNLEEQALKMVGKDVYEKLIKHYTEKQWGKKATELPAFIIKRLPVRFTYDNNYFTDKYQGIPIGGYTQMVEKMLLGSELRLNTDFFQDPAHFRTLGKTLVYTGKIDEFYDYRFGVLEYRSLEFQLEVLDQENYQGNAVMNFTDAETPYTRIYEHKHFEFGKQAKTVITKEFPCKNSEHAEPYYPINDASNQSLYQRYQHLAKQERHVIFGGRLAEYRYYDMHQVIASALTKASHQLKHD